MNEKMSVGRATVLAAMVLLHRELDANAEVRLTRAQIDAYEDEDTSTRIEWDQDEATGDVLLRHYRPGKSQG